MSKRDIAVIPVNPLFVIPSREEVTDIKQISGVNPPFSSLKNHPEYNGMKILVMHAELKNGTIPDASGAVQDYVLMACAVFPPSRQPSQDDVQIIATGAGNVFTRVKDAIVAGVFPIEGTLRNAGRAWFID